MVYLFVYYSQFLYPTQSIIIYIYIYLFIFSFVCLFFGVQFRSAGADKRRSGIRGEGGREQGVQFRSAGAEKRRSGEAELEERAEASRGWTPAP